MTPEEIEKSRTCIERLDIEHERLGFDVMKKEWIDDREFDPDMEPHLLIYVPECSYLGDTNLMFQGDTDGNGGYHCDYVQTACQNYPKALDTIEALRRRIEELES